MWRTTTCALAFILSPLLSGQSYDLLMRPGLVQGRTVYSVNQYGQLIPNTTLWVTPFAYNNTNGHFHNANRPTSQVASTQGGIFSSLGTFVTTNQYGSATVWVKPGAIGQAEYLTACAQYCKSGDHAVGYSNIYWVEEKPQWIHIGGNTTNHGSNAFNHWMASSSAYNLWYTAVEYLSRYPGQGKIAVNDMSLPYGGVFDAINQNWLPPHAQHSTGGAVDIRGNTALYAVPNAQQPEFRQICLDKGAYLAITEFPGTSNQHIHCEW